MIPLSVLASELKQYFPRIRGDDPEETITLKMYRKFSPYSRG